MVRRRLFFAQQFKEVQESRQVVYLAPTTILAQQVYNTFVQRMKEFPVRVDLLCRFRTPAQQKKTLQDLKKRTGRRCDRYPQSSFQGCGV